MHLKFPDLCNYKKIFLDTEYYKLLQVQRKYAAYNDCNEQNSDPIIYLNEDITTYNRHLCQLHLKRL